MRLELLLRPLHGRRLHVGHEELRALRRQQTAEVLAHTTQALNGDLHALEIGTPEAEFHRRLDAEVDPERGLRARIAARPPRRGTEAGHVARGARNVRHVGDGRADVLGGDVTAPERIDQPAEGLEELRSLGLA